MLPILGLENVFFPGFPPQPQIFFNPIGRGFIPQQAEPKVREELRAWAIQHRKDTGKPELKLKEDELPADEDDMKKDEEVRLKILAWIDSDHPQLVTMLIAKDEGEGRGQHRGRVLAPRRGHDAANRLSISERRRRSTSYSGSSESSSSSESSESRSRSRSRERTPPKKRRERERSLSRSSEDSEDARERRNLKKQIKEKEQAYVSRLTKWEARERQKAKQYEREERREKDRRRDILKEAKKLKHFLEDYDDEKDDPKYYKSSSLFQRKRDFEREREADSKDRLREQQEIEELRKQILAENKDVQDVDEEARRRHFEKEEAALRRLREDSGSPNPHQPLGQRDGDGDSSSSSVEESEDEEDGKSLDGKSIVDVTSQSTPMSVSSPVTLRGTSSTASLPAVPRPELNSRLNGVFGVDDEEEEGGRNKLRPFEITQEDRMETLTTDEKKRMVKDLINNIPTTKEELFAHTIDWRYVDRPLIEQRVRPWVAKKIMEFLGEEEGALVDFVCEKVANKTSPDRILGDIAMILDEDAEVFVVKMWRLLIYESEAKKLGLVVPRSTQ
ncbi:PWI domain protein [Teladorsagia circumcincta]|uniref:PWI domain protein n=1 Tax=Teladorsagia circumcincta TaxID=45464 RepID=A0A2G9V159_TELCI|nr:PWI domain protein [Teladorsagia circumcincta]